MLILKRIDNSTKKAALINRKLFSKIERKVSMLNK
jgi:hypothetical protein